MKELLEVVLGKDKLGFPSPFDGVGVNCTKPKFLKKLVGDMTAALPQVSRTEKSYLFVSICSALDQYLRRRLTWHHSLVVEMQIYPDGGLVWDGMKRVWMGGKGSETSSLSWPDLVMDAAAVALGDGNSVWGGCFVGGCCKATTKDIAALRLRVDAASSS
jgi:homocysteine S-methyltransferase